MESFQKRERDRRKVERRHVKEARRKERAERRRGAPVDAAPRALNADGMSSLPRPSPIEQGVAP